MIYVAIRTCFYGDVLWKEGDKIDFVREVIPCPECEEGKKDGKPCLKCKGTGRSDPPHHFMPKSMEKAKVEALQEETEQAEIDAIRDEIKKLGGDYDKRWGLTRLKNALITTRKTKGR